MHSVVRYFHKKYSSMNFCRREKNTFFPSLFVFFFMAYFWLWGEICNVLKYRWTLPQDLVIFLHVIFVIFVPKAKKNTTFEKNRLCILTHFFFLDEYRFFSSKIGNKIFCILYFIAFLHRLVLLEFASSSATTSYFSVPFSTLSNII